MYRPWEGDVMRVAALCGSLREGSYNQALLDTVIDRAGAHGPEIVQVPIRDFTLFSQDLEADPPAEVTAAKELIQSADCLLLVTPEYNFGVPGVLKNAIDWLSRPFGDPTLRGRGMALMGASTGYMGTVRAQLAWRQLWHFFRSPVFTDVEVLMTSARDKVRGGQVVDPATLEVLDRYLEALHTWLGRIS